MLRSEIGRDGGGGVCEGGRPSEAFYSHIPGHGNYSMKHLNSNYLLQMRATENRERQRERA